VDDLFIKNLEWAEKVKKDNPDFFQGLSEEHAPEYLWIGCSDSRVPANEIIGLMPGELFVHRNVANLVVHSDLNCLSVIQLAVESLQVKHVIVCGHYGCGGVTASVSNQKLGGLIDNWLLNVQDVEYLHKASIDYSSQEKEIISQVCELNVIEQAVNVSRTSVVLDAWGRGQELTIHGWIYNMTDGLLKDLGVNITNAEEVMPKYRSAVENINRRYSGG
jgi:carbonic anhydrase|tara:strand:+ start:3912 stop:4568 length:657 start_codon:yes stop_codon:yes gene_type:complete